MGRDGLNTCSRFTASLALEQPSDAVPVHQEPQHDPDQPCDGPAKGSRAGRTSGNRGVTAANCHRKHREETARESHDRPCTQECGTHGLPFKNRSRVFRPNNRSRKSLHAHDEQVDEIGHVEQPIRRKPVRVGRKTSADHRAGTMTTALAHTQQAWISITPLPYNGRERLVRRVAMFFLRKAKPVECVVCGKVIAPKESRVVDKNRLTRVERHAHVSCRELTNRGKT